MFIRLIIASFFTLTISDIVSSVKYKNIGDCYYYDDIYGKSNLTLICVREIRETTLFKPYDTTVCLNQNQCNDCADGFFKFMIGRITFENCDLQQIPTDMFKVYDNVRIFNISDLGIDTLQPDHFIDAIHLTTLNASFNKIDEIVADLFAHSLDILHVDFSFNVIKNLHPHAFGVGNHLKTLNLSHNNLSELSVETFQKLTELTHLQLSHNQIAELPSFLFHKNDKLIEVDLSQNKIEKIDNFAFAGDFKLKKLNMSHNQLTAFHRRFSDNHSNLTHLDLSDNRIGALKGDTFESLRILMVLDLSSNLLNKLDNKTFGKLVMLKQLNLSHNKLDEITWGTFSTLIQLEILDLSNNDLKMLDAFILPAQTNLLDILSIANNELRELNGFNSARIPNTKIIGIDNNPFNCSYLDKLFQSITWKHLDAISKRIQCSSSNDISKSSDSSEDSTFSWMQVSTDADEIASTDEMNQTEMLTVNSDEIEIGKEGNVAGKPDGKIGQKSEEITDERTEKEKTNIENAKETVAQSMKIENDNTLTFVNIKNDLNKLKHYLYILVCIITVCFTITALLFTRLIRQTQILQKERTKAEIDVKYTIDSNGVDNHAYEVIEFTKN